VNIPFSLNIVLTIQIITIQFHTQTLNIFWWGKQPDKDINYSMNIQAVYKQPVVKFYTQNPPPGRVNKNGRSDHKMTDQNVELQ
jgi:hypothetical protein